MPSYRLELQIGDLRPGRAAPEVLDAARASLGDLHVDATDITVTDTFPWIVLRFTVPPSNNTEENAAALSAARGVQASVERVATTGRRRVQRRRGGHWIPLD